MKGYLKSRWLTETDKDEWSAVGGSEDFAKKAIGRFTYKVEYYILSIIFFIIYENLYAPHGSVTQ